MIIEYTLTAEDYLTFHLFTSSKSALIKKKRSRNKILVPVCYLIIGVFSFYNGKQIFAVLMALASVLWYFLYPIREKARYVKYFKDFIKENHQEKIGRTVTLEIQNDLIFSKDSGGEGKILTTEIAELNEIPHYIFLKFKTGQVLIFPKDKMPAFEALRTRLRELASYLSIPYNVDEHWKWK